MLGRTTVEPVNFARIQGQRMHLLITLASSPPLCMILAIKTYRIECAKGDRQAYS